MLGCVWTFGPTFYLSIVLWFFDRRPNFTYNRKMDKEFSPYRNHQIFDNCQKLYMLDNGKCMGEKIDPKMISDYSINKIHINNLLSIVKLYKKNSYI